MKKILCCLVWIIFSMGTISASAAPIFDIVVEYKPAGELVDNGAGNTSSPTEEFSDRQKQLFGVAESFWESVITGFQGIVNASYNLVAWLTPEDGPDGSLAFAGPRTFETTSSGFDRATSGIMQFDADDFGVNALFPQSEQLFLDSAIHEIAHALGFGTQFSFNGLVDASGNNYIGTQAVAAFNATNGTSVTSILLEDGGGHWNECWVEGLTAPCAPEDGSSSSGLFNDPELMTPFAVDYPATISAATIAAFSDLGYETIDPFTNISLPIAANIPAEVPEPGTGLLMFAALLGLYASGVKRS
jgi:hypothetical protein